MTAHAVEDANRVISTGPGNEVVSSLDCPLNLIQELVGPIQIANTNRGQCLAREAPQAACLITQGGEQQECLLIASVRLRKVGLPEGQLSEGLQSNCLGVCFRDLARQVQHDVNPLTALAEIVTRVPESE